MITASVDVFCCYAQVDYSFAKGLKTHLVPLQRQGLITIWNAAWRSDYLLTASIIILLISPDFIASDYCDSVEMKSALARHNRGEAQIIPIIVRPTVWEQTPFSHLQALPRNGKPITRQRNRDEAFLEIAKEILSIVKEHNEQVTISNASDLPTVSSHIIEDSLARPHVLVVDDDERLLEFLKLGFRYEGFDGSFVTNGEDALIFMQIYAPDVAILDIGLKGGIGGFEICRAIRANPKTRNTLVLILSARDNVSDRIVGLDKGADDYLIKPFDFDELIARLRALLRRRDRLSDNKDENELKLLEFGNLRLDLTNHMVSQSGNVIELNDIEYNLLLLFMSHPRRVLDRQTILNRVWGNDFLGETNVIEAYITNLREKIEDSPSQPRLIQTVRGVGYVLKG